MPKANLLLPNLLLRCAAACAMVGWLAMPAAGQTGDTPAGAGANPPPGHAAIPPIQLTEAQRAQVRAAVAGERTEVSFAIKSAKSSQSFEPAVGAKLPKGIQAHPLPRPLIYTLPVLREYEYVKFKDEILIINPMTKRIVELLPQS